MHPELIPPFTARMIPSMYTSGALRAEGLALKCVSFNHNLYRTLLASEEQLAKPATAMFAAKKRKLSGGVERGPNKKAKV